MRYLLRLNGSLSVHEWQLECNFGSDALVSEYAKGVLLNDPAAKAAEEISIFNLDEDKFVEHLVLERPTVRRVPCG